MCGAGPPNWVCAHQFFFVVLFCFFEILNVCEDENMTTVASFHLAQTLLRKAVTAITDRSAKTTRRLDKCNASQTYAWLFSGPDVVFTDPDHGSTISIGSYRNAWAMEQSDFDCVINCCPLEGIAPSVNAHSVFLADTDDVSLDPVLPFLDSVIADVRRVLSTNEGRILCHCWMGASRSVAVAIYLLCRIYGTHAYPSVDAAFMHYYNAFKRCRPCINVSVQLKNEVCRVLQEVPRQS